MLGNSQRGLSPKDKRLIYLTTCVPILTYGFQLWYRHNAKGCKNLLKKLEKNALLNLASLDLIQVTLEKLSYRAAMRIHMIHPSAGIAQGHKPRTSFLKASAGRLHIHDTTIIMEPPFTKGHSSTKRGPLAALRDLPLPALTREHHNDLHPPGTQAINLFQDRITHIDIP
ncbi:hypothetical protein AX15_007909 [Amanita polypyramis BW_CC]|nr:hypothetical protein AX15_007909 [Amanita polypyramis BW_CC]